jgi:hypothetical protein
MTVGFPGSPAQAAIGVPKRGKSPVARRGI